MSGVVTFLFAFAFVGLCVSVFLLKGSKSFNEAAQLPLVDDDHELQSKRDKK